VTTEFLDLPEAAQQTFLAHLAAHEERVAEQTQAYASEAQMLAGQSQSPTGEAPPEKAPGLASPYSGGGGPYEGIMEPTLPDAEGGPLPSPEELAGTT